MSTPKDEEIKVRVPAPIKRAIQKIAADRFTSESEIAREAFIDYIKSHPAGLAVLQQISPQHKVSSAQKEETDERVLNLIRSRTKKPHKKKTAHEG